MASFLRVRDVMELLDISQSTAYRIMRNINKELETKGYETLSGRVSKKRFREKFYDYDCEENEKKVRNLGREKNGKNKRLQQAK